MFSERYAGTKLEGDNADMILRLLGMRVSNHTTSRLVESMPFEVNQTNGENKVVGGIFRNVKAEVHTLSWIGSVMRGGMSESM
jgi:hypothetical protein